MAGSMSSAQLELIKTVVKDKEIAIATDNDKDGNRYAIQIREFSPDAIRDIPKNKDWNDDLKEIHLMRELMKEENINGLEY
ncbi:toprim domain-containing protein [Bathymodiolus japonicus methanotrophic gill symbiont]|uniref:toprim domain-containing protein n=1 Tax=Bathymodiolus japonicus methanotrophic gill symbiont TaxID=113269 RepID=UPI001E2D7A58|nr:toprim domain-containing protein [Bathymodiolus japonicus methanotrophic gill symbiont]